MIYEWRVYETLPGRMPELNKRFAEKILALFDKHGIEVVGFWQVDVGQTFDLCYMVRFPDAVERHKRWDALRADPELIAAIQESEADGKIVKRVRNALLRPTDYSPLQ